MKSMRRMPLLLALVCGMFLVSAADACPRCKGGVIVARTNDCLCSTCRPRCCDLLPNLFRTLGKTLDCLLPSARCCPSSCAAPACSSCGGHGHGHPLEAGTYMHEEAVPAVPEEARRILVPQPAANSILRRTGVSIKRKAPAAKTRKPQRVAESKPRAPVVHASYVKQVTSPAKSKKPTQPRKSLLQFNVPTNPLRGR